MQNQVFKITTNEEKQNKLKRILKGKLPSISNEQLHKIFQSIDYDKQYTIKATSKIEKFKNIVVHERVETSSQTFHSYSTSIYGDFEPGLFENIYGVITKVPSQTDPYSSKAAVKEILMKKGDKIETEYQLVVYCPREEMRKIS